MDRTAHDSNQKQQLPPQPLQQQSPQSQQHSTYLRSCVKPHQQYETADQLPRNKSSAEGATAKCGTPTNRKILDFYNRSFADFRNNFEKLLSELQENFSLTNSSNSNADVFLQNGSQLGETDEKPTFVDELAVQGSKRQDMKDERIHELESQFQEVVRVNAEWEKYCQQQAEQTKRLQRELDEARITTRSPGLDDEEQQRIDRLVTQYKKKIEEMEDGKEKISDENRQLRIKVRQLGETISDQENTSRQMSARLAELETALVEERARAEEAVAASMLRDQDVLQERRRAEEDETEVLKQQAQMYQEDFNSERRDREKAQSKISDLENEMIILRAQLEEYRILHDELIAQGGLNQRRIPYAGYQPLDNRYHQHARRGLITGDGESENRTEHDRQLEEGGRDEIDSAARPTIRQQTARPADASTRQTNEKRLLCPNCKKEFPTSQHQLLLEHLDECCHSSKLRIAMD